MTTKGFTLVESLIAVSILALAIVGPLSVVDRTLVAVYTARDQLTATYLAQEGIEYMRALRDDYYLADPAGGWDDFIAKISTGGNNCTAALPLGCSLNLDATTPLRACSRDDGPYNYNSCAVNNVTGTLTTIFNRSVHVEGVPGLEEEIVVSQVRWKEHGVSYNVTLTDHLTPWQ